MKRPRWAAAVAMGLLGVMVLASCGETNPEQKREVPKMSTQDVVSRIRQKDWDVVGATKASVQAGPAIAALLDDDDPEVRELAVTCLGEAGGEAARLGLLRALGDEDTMVRAVAARSLSGNITRDEEPALLRALAESDDEYVRENVVLALGRLEDPALVEALRPRLDAEADPDARHAVSIALVRLGDEQSRSQFLERLQNEDIAGRVAALRDMLYVGDRSLVRYVLPLLDDKRDAANVAPSGARFFIRVCDVAVNVLDVLLDHPFSFEVNQISRYPDSALAEAKATVSGLR